MARNTSGIYPDRSKLHGNTESSRFIQSVREDDCRDRIVDDAFKRSTMENPYLKQVNTTIKLCAELKEEARQRFLEEKRRQQLRENNQDLKQLEAQLRAAYVKKAVSAQIYEKETLQKKEKIIEHHNNLALEQARLQREEAAKKQEEADRLKRATLKQELQEQIAWSNANRMKKYELLLKEKEMLDEVMKKCKEDKEKEAIEAAERKQKAKIEMDEFKQAQQECNIAQNLANEQENKRIEELIRQRDMEQQRIQQEKQEQRLLKEQISEEIGNRIHAIAKEEARGRECLVELLIDERQAKEEMQERLELERQLQYRISTQLDLERDRADKERRKLEQKKLDDAYFQEEMRILAERDKLDQLSNEKRRRKQMEHRRSLQEALAEKKRLKAEQMKNFLHDREKELNEIERNQQLVEEERTRMIQEHASGLLGYLAPGVLRDSDRIILPIPTKRN